MRVRSLLMVLVGAFALLVLSPMAGLAQQTSCIECHAGLGGDLGRPVGEWQRSIHAENRVYCFNCHGGDPADFTMLAMSPEKGFIGVPTEEEIPPICGQCHIGVTEDYFRSVHGQTLGAGGPHCATCHGNHAVQRTTPDLINPQLCSSCHDYGRADEIRQAVIATDRSIAELDASLRSFHLLGIDTEAMAGQLFAARNRFHRLFHSVDVDLVREQTAGIQQELTEVRAQVEGIRGELNRRKLGGALLVGLLLAAALVAALIRRSYHQEEIQGR
jgi:hypothetical protein